MSEDKAWLMRLADDLMAPHRLSPMDARILREIANRIDTPAPQLPDQACGAEDEMLQAFYGDGASQVRELLQSVPSRPAPADAVKVLVEALEPFGKRTFSGILPEDGDSTDFQVKHVRRAAAALSDPRVIAAQSADPWLPIASAPRNGREVLAYTKRYGIIEIFWVDDAWVSNAVTEEETLHELEILGWRETMPPPPLPCASKRSRRDGY